MKFVDILLIEDDPLDVIDIKRNLDKLNIHYKMEIAGNGEEAVCCLNEKHLNKKYPDIVLLDINMPRMNGFEFLRLIKKSNDLKELKYFIISSSEQQVDKNTAKSLGISGYIVKPVKLSNPKTIDSFNLMIDLMNI